MSSSSVPAPSLPPQGMVPGVSLAGLAEAVTASGYCFVPGPSTRQLIEHHGALLDWPQFAASWDDLAVDGYMADHGRYRRRRHAVYAATVDGGIVRAPHQPHYQALDYNVLNGGVERWFEPVDAQLGDGPAMRAVLGFCRELFERLHGAPAAWRVEVHQFRIEAVAGEAGLPTPEGMHRDGVDYVLVLLVRRCNIDSGTTMIGNGTDGFFSSFTLVEPFDAALVDDHRVFHGVTPVQPHDASAPAFRDVLVVTFKLDLSHG